MIAVVTKVTSFVTRRRKSHEDEGDNIVNTNGHSDDRGLSKPGSFLTSINITSIKIESFIISIVLTIQIWFTVNFPPLILLKLIIVNNLNLY